jgi:GntR family transcriptional regulator, transcriptional repressor for pyruvate dehydrogenase complex
LLITRCVRARAPRATLADGVAENLKRRILSGLYAPGDKLPAELVLASELDVNRFTVREAMNKLEQLHLIARRPGSGTVVLDYTSHASVDVIEYLVLTGDGLVNTELLANLLEFARVLSSENAALAAERRSDEDLAALDVIVARMRGEKNLSKLLWLDFDFNWTLAGAARNLVPRLLMNSVRGLLAKYTHLLETLWVSPGSITQGYEHVVEAVRARDAERARALLRSIWEARHARFVAAAGRESRPPRAETR